METNQTSSKAVYSAFSNYDENATLAMFSLVPSPACPRPENGNDILGENDYTRPIHTDVVNFQQ